jgi:Xaa-Pro aminopeptidase
MATVNLSLEERDRRYKAIRELMEQHGYDCLIITGRDGYITRGNLRYVTSYGVNFGEQYCLFPADGEPVFLGSVMASAQVRRAGWVAESVIVTDASEQVISAIRNYDKGNRIGLVGLPYTSVPLYLALNRSFHDRLCDATPLFMQLRLIKSGEEVELIRASAAVADRAYEVAREMTKPGLTDYRICGEVKRAVYAMGSEYSMEFMDIGPAGLNLFHPVGKTLGEQDALALEITPACQGYYAQLTVSIPATSYRDSVQPLLTAWRAALALGEALLGPGIMVSDLCRQVSEAIAAHGYKSHLRLGHGIGLDALDIFSLSQDESTVLKPGMTLAFHPCVALGEGSEAIGMGYTYLITDIGCERFSRIEL